MLGRTPGRLTGYLFQALTAFELFRAWFPGWVSYGGYVLLKARRVNQLSQGFAFFFIFVGNCRQQLRTRATWRKEIYNPKQFVW